MRRVVFAAAVLGSVAGLVLVAGTGRASLYSPEEPFAVPVGADGKATPLPFPEFKRRLGVLGNARVEPKKGEKDNSDREPFLKRIAERKKIARPAAPEAAALAADLYRVGRLDEALNLLKSLRRPDYFAFATLGHIRAARGEWADALATYEDQRDTKMPAGVKGLTKPQRDWWERLDAEYVPHFYRTRKDEEEARLRLTPAEREKAAETEAPLPLFPLPGEGEPRAAVRFVNEKGEYQPGVIAAAEKAKLPPDAIAVVQQLLLWMPTDTRLYWLLGELYAASGDVVVASQILDDCTWGRQYGNRAVLMAHRQALMAAAKAAPTPATPEDAPLGQPDAPADAPGGDPAPPISMQTVLIYFGVVGLIALLALVRTLGRRAKDGCGPVG